MKKHNGTFVPDKCEYCSGWCHGDTMHCKPDDVVDLDRENHIEMKNIYVQLVRERMRYSNKHVSDKKYYKSLIKNTPVFKFILNEKPYWMK